MRDYYCNYIPDMTERFPEGMRSFEDPCYVYDETPYEELCVTDPDYTNKEDETMKGLNFEQLNMELRNRGIVYDVAEHDEYEQYVELQSIYGWGFITVTNCRVLPPIITFYDWECQSILRLDSDDCSYKIHDGVLFVTEQNVFCDTKKSFVVDLKQGACVHVDDIAAIGYAPNASITDDRRFYALKDGRIYFKQDGESLRLLKDVTVDTLIRQGYVIIDPDNYGANIDVLNDMLARF